MRAVFRSALSEAEVRHALQSLLSGDRESDSAGSGMSVSTLRCGACDTFCDSAFDRSPHTKFTRLLVKFRQRVGHPQCAQRRPLAT